MGLTICLKEQSLVYVLFQGTTTSNTWGFREHYFRYHWDDNTWISLMEKADCNTVTHVKLSRRRLMSGRGRQKGEEWGACWKTMLISLQRGAEQWRHIRHLHDLKEEVRQSISVWKLIQSREKVMGLFAYSWSPVTWSSPQSYQQMF